MTSADLAREMATARRCLSGADREALIAAGISAPVIAAGLIGAALVRLAGDLFEPDPDGRFAFLTPVRVYDAITPESPHPIVTVRAGALIDILAWHPKHPQRWALRRGLATWAGACWPQYLDPPPVRVWRSPANWLRSGCRGLCLVSRVAADAYRVLSLLKGNVAEDRAHRAELQAILASPWPAPPVLLPQGARHAA